MLLGPSPPRAPGGQDAVSFTNSLKLQKQNILVLQRPYKGEYLNLTNAEHLTPTQTEYLILTNTEYLSLLQKQNILVVQKQNILLGQRRHMSVLHKIQVKSEAGLGI